MSKLVNGVRVDLTTEETAAINIVKAENTANAVPNAQAAKIAELNEVFATVSERPRAETSLGFAVDGSHRDLANFQVGKDLGLLSVKDADNVRQTIVVGDYDGILLAIKAKGAGIMDAKWTHGENIAALTTVDAVNAYDVTIGWPS